MLPVVICSLLQAIPGLDPDFINTNIWNSGTDSFSYPNTRSVMFGLDLTF